MISLQDVRKENTKKHNPSCPSTSDHPYRILITVGSGSGKTNLLFNLVSQQSHTDKVY